MSAAFSRRAFLVGGSALVASQWLGRRAARAAAGTELYLGSFKTARYDGKITHELSAVDAAGRRHASIPLTFHFHGLAPHPTERRRAVLFEKQGPGACEVDLVEKKVRRPVTTTDDRKFYGHGAFSPDGRVLYATETILASGEGVIVVRDGRTLAITGELPTFGAKPHDCVLIDGGRTLVVTNGGGPLEGAAPCVTFVDVRTRKLREKLTFDNPRVNAGHLALTSRRELLVISAPRSGLPGSEPGAISVRDKDHLRVLAEPAEVTRKMIGETLSLAVHEPSGVVAVTNPDGDLVTFWSYPRGAFVKSLALEHPRGVTLTRDRRFFIVSHGRDPLLSFISTATLERDPARDVPGARMSGSHMYTWQV